MLSNKFARALLLASASMPVLAMSPALAADVTIGAGQTRTTQVLLAGTDTLTIASTGALTVSSGGAVSWTGPATGAGVVVNNDGTITGSGPINNAITTAPAVTSGTFTINNTGIIQNSFVVLSANNIPAATKIVINNSGTISNTNTNIGNLMNVGAGGASFTLTNTGTIRGNINPGLGVNTLNLVTGSTFTGNFVPNPGGTNTVNLSGTGSGYVRGQTEPPLPAPTTFMGLNNVQTMNVNSGTWTLIGGGYYNTLNIANGAAFHICDLPSGVTCAATYDGLNGTPTDGGIGALGASLTVIDNGTLISDSNDTRIKYDPAATAVTASFSGTGLFKVTGAGRQYVDPNMTVSVANLEVAGGSMVVAGGISSAVLVDAGAVLQIGSGGNLKNSGNVTVDDGKVGTVSGTITANGTVTFARLDSYTYAGSLGGSGLVTKAGAGATSLTGSNAFTGSVDVQGGTLSAANPFQMGGADTVKVAAGATLSGTATNALFWAANATGAGMVINNAGTLSSTGTGTQTNVAPNGTFTWDGPSAISAANGVTGNLTVNNDGTISSTKGPAIFTGPSAAGSSVTINNNAGGIITGNGGGHLNANVIPASVAMYLGNGNDVLNNYGKINGAVLMGPGDDIINVYNGAINSMGALNGNVGNNTVNLLDPNGGYAKGHSEVAFQGWDAFQTVNVQNGRWFLVGVALWTRLTIASGATLNVCDAITCRQGQTVTDNGFVPLTAGTIVNNGTLAFITDNPVPYYHTNQGAVAMTGSGTLVYGGTGLSYLPANLSLTGFTGTIDAASGKLVVAGTVANAVTIETLGTLQIGSGGNLINRDGVAVDDGKTGALSGAITDNGTLIFNRVDSYALTGTVTGNGAIVQAGSGTTSINAASGFTGTWRVQSGKLVTNINLAGAQTVTVDASGALQQGGNAAAITWTGNATGAGIVVNNAGTISAPLVTAWTLVAPNGTFNWVGRPVVSAASGVTGVLTINNSGTMTAAGPAIFTGGSGAGSSTIVNNNAGGVITGQGSGTLNTTTIPGPVAIYLGNGADTLNNRGIINGSVFLGPGDDILNVYNGAFAAITGNVNGNLGNNTINLLDPNGGYAHGHAEAGTGAMASGWDAIQTVNVQAGSWTLVGAALWTRLNIASGASFNVCDAAACKPAGQSSLDNGFVPLGAGTVVNNGVLTFTSDNAVPYTHTNQGALAISGTGKLLKDGAGTLFLAVSNTVQQKDFEVAKGTLATSAILNGAVLIDAGGTLQIGTGGTLVNRDGAVLDDGKAGNVIGSIVDNGTLVFNRLDDFTMTADLSGNGGIVKQNGNTVTLTGKYTFTGTTQILGGKLLVGGALSPDSSLQVGGGTSVDLQGSSQTVAGLVDAPASGTTGGGSGTGNSPVPAATVNLGGGTLTVNQTSSGSFSGNLTGSGTLTVNAGTGTGGNTLVLNGNSSGFTGTTNITGGTLQVGSSSAPNATLGGAVNITGGKLEVGDASAPGATLVGSVTVGSGGTLGGHGTIAGSVTNAGTTAPGGSIGTLHVAGNYAFGAGALLEQEVNANGTADLLRSDGVVTIGTGATVQVEPEGTLSAYGRVTNYTIVIGSRIDGSFAGVTSTIAGLRPILGYSDGAVNLALVRTDINLSALATTANQTGVAAAVNAGGGALYDAVAVNSDIVARQAFDLASGEVHASLASAILQNDGQLAAAVLRSPHGDGVTVWGEEGASWSQFGAAANTAAFRDHALRAAAGVDVPLGSGLRAGVSAGYSSDTVGAAARASDGSISSLSLGGYAAAAEGPLSVIAGLDYAWHNIATQRRVGFGNVSEAEAANYDGNSLNLFSQVSYRLDLDEAFHLEPTASIRWSRLRIAAFNEAGGAFALSAGARDSDVSFIDLGTWLGRDFAMTSGALSVRLFGGWEHAGGDLTPFDAMRLSNGAAFNVLGAPISKDAAKLGAELALRFNAGIDVKLSYDGRFAGRSQENGVSAHLGWHF